METNSILHTSLIILGLITFFIAIKPGIKLKRFTNMFWVAGNLFFIAAFIITYLENGEFNYTSLAMLFFTNILMVTQGKPLRLRK